MGTVFNFETKLIFAGYFGVVFGYF